VVKHGGGGAGGGGGGAGSSSSAFSKAFFVADDEAAGVDMDDPAFWEKVLPEAPPAAPDPCLVVPEKRKV
jgi:hypothetical protein